MADQRPGRYRAFISYSHKDSLICSKLHKRLDGYRIPKELVGAETDQGAVPARLHPVFRDRDELATSADLSTTIKEALELSENLVVICSSNAAASKWVDAEIAYFVEMGRADRIHPVIVEGDPPHCFPPSLREALAEPLAADLRDDADGLDDGALKTIAGLLGVPLGRLKDREAARARQRARTNAMLAGTFGVLALLAIGAAVFAWHQSNKAQLAIEAGLEGLGAVADIVAEESGTGGVRRTVGDALLNEMKALADRVIDIAPSNELLVAERGRLGIISARYHRTMGDLQSAEREAREAEALYGELATHGSGWIAADRQRAAAQNEIGDTLRMSGDVGGAIAAYETALEIGRDRLADAPRDALLRHDISVALDKLADLQSATGDLDAAAQNYAEGAEIARALAAEDPADPSLAFDHSLGLGKLADIAFQRGDDAQALTLLGDARVEIERALTLDPANARWARARSAIAIQTGDVLQRSGDFAKAAEEFTNALMSRERLVQQDPGDLGRLADLALAHGRVGSVTFTMAGAAAAIPHFEQAADLYRQLIDEDRTNAEWLGGLSATLTWLGDHARDSGQIDDALANYAEGAQLSQRLFDLAPNSTDTARNLSISLERLAGMRTATGDTDGALDLREQALRLVRDILAREPDALQASTDLATTLVGVGESRLAANDQDGAADAYDEALALRRTQVAQRPDDRALTRELSVTLDRLAEVRRVQGNDQRALAHHEESLGIARDLAATAPGDLAALKDLAIGLDLLGDTLLDAGERMRAVAAYEEKATIWAQIAEQEPAYHADVVVAYDEVARLLQEDGAPNRAIAMLEAKLRALGPLLPSKLLWRIEHERTLRTLADLHLQTKAPDKAAPLYRQALGVARENLAEDGTQTLALIINLDRIGNLSSTAGDTDRARTAWEERLDLVRAQADADPAWRVDLAIALDKLGDLYLGRRDTTAARAAYRETLGYVSGFAEADPNWRTDLARMHIKLAATDEATAQANLTTAIAILEELDRTGQLADIDRPMLDTARSRLNAIANDD